MSDHDLHGVCEYEFLEAPSSWLVRVALGQGVPVNELCKWLEIKYGPDLDINFAEANVRAIARRCGFAETTFFPISRMLRSIQSLGYGEPPLLQAGSKAAYQFCSICLREQETPFFPLHWRLRPYKMCYRHSCLMERMCSLCGRSVTLARQRAEIARASIAFVTQCMCCGHLLSKAEPVFVSELSYQDLSWQEREQLDNGCAFASALAFDLTARWFRAGNLFQSEGDLLEILPGDWIPSPDAIRRRKLGTAA